MRNYALLFLPLTSLLAATYPIVDTEQSICYNSTTGNEISCSGTGYDADYTGNQPSYTTSTQGGIVTDNVTGLMWTQSSDTDGDGVTTDADDKLSLSEATSYCEALSLEGYDDWRLPDIKTLYSLMLFTGEDPSGYNGSDTSVLKTFLDNSFERAFGDTSAGERIIDGQYATTTTYVSYVFDSAPALFGLNLVDGRIKGYPYTNKDFYVLCVRGNESYGINSFSDNGDGSISDAATELMWEQNDTQSSNFNDAITYCETADTAGYDDWRLPNAKELQSILDYSRSPDTNSSAAIDPLFNATSFLNEEGVTDWGSYWSSTTHANYSGSGAAAAYVSFGRALGYMEGNVLDVHGAGAQRSDGKVNISDGSATATGYGGELFYYKGPQGDIQRLDNMVRCVRDVVLSGTSTSYINPSLIMYTLD